MSIIVNPLWAKDFKLAENNPQMRDELITEFYQELADSVEDAIKLKRHLIVWGEPGASKSVIVDQVASRYPQATKYKGKMTPFQFYEMLYKHRNDILILDDCSVWLDSKDCRETLMAATDSTDGWVHWNDNSNTLKLKGIPPKFKYKGSIIIVTNTPMIERESSNTPIDIAINTLLSRMNQFCANLPDNEYNLATIKLWHKNNAIKCFEGVSESDQAEILDMLEQNRDVIRKLSFRAVFNCVKKLEARGSGRWQRSALAEMM